MKKIVKTLVNAQRFRYFLYCNLFINDEINSAVKKCFLYS